MGLIGMAFGLGFVAGPLLGGLLLTLPVEESLRLKIPFLVSAGFSTIAWILVLTRLPEPKDVAGARRQAARVVSWRGIADSLTLPGVGRLVVLAALIVLSFAALEGTYSLYLRERLHWDARRAAFGFAFLGFVSAFVQGGLIRRLVPRFGEPRLIVAGVATLVVGFLALGLVRTGAGLVGATFLVGIGQGLASPSASGLLSRVTPDSEQGAVFGVLSSAQTLARMANYLAANLLLARIGPAAPFWEAAAVASVALIVALSIMSPRGHVARHVADVSAESEARHDLGVYSKES
jgi:DHA1 family tetracycline resistance protein-like MFS transporter